MYYITCHHVSPQGDSTRTKKEKNVGKRAGHKVREGREKPRQVKGDEVEKKETLYYAELRASCFCPHFLVFLIRQAIEMKRVC